MRTTLLALLVSAVLCSGCAWRGGAPLPVPDQTIPHRLSRPATVHLWIRSPTGGMTELEVEAPVGWWLASPTVVEGAAQ